MPQVPELQKNPIIEDVLSSLTDEIFVHGIRIPPELPLPATIVIPLVHHDLFTLNNALIDYIDGSNTLTFLAVMSLIAQLRQRSDWFSLLPVTEAEIKKRQQQEFAALEFSLTEIFDLHTTQKDDLSGDRVILESARDMLVSKIAQFFQFLAVINHTQLIGFEEKSAILQLVEQVGNKYLDQESLHKLMVEVVDYLAQNPA